MGYGRGMGRRGRGMSAAGGGGRFHRGAAGGKHRGRGSLPQMQRAPWQRNLHLPDLDPDSPGLRILAFACFRCGTPIVTGEQIYRIGDPDSDKNMGPGAKGLLNCLFTNCLPDTLEVAGEPFWNASNGCYVREVFCKVCLERGTAGPSRRGSNIGSYYDNAELPDDAEPDTLGLNALDEFCKLGHYRTHKDGGDRLDILVAIGKQAEVEAVLEGRGAALKD